VYPHGENHLPGKEKPSLVTAPFEPFVRTPRGKTFSRRCRKPCANLGEPLDPQNPKWGKKGPNPKGPKQKPCPLLHPGKKKPIWGEIPPWEKRPKKPCEPLKLKLEEPNLFGLKQKGQSSNRFWAKNFYREPILCSPPQIPQLASIQSYLP